MTFSKAITLWEPWASAIVFGPKRIENRPWKPPRSILGERLGIHAGKKYDADAFGGIIDIWPEVIDQPHRQGVIGSAIVAGYVHCADDLFDKTTWFSAAAHTKLVRAVALEAGLGRADWFVGPYGWVLTDVESLAEPIPIKGAQGIWSMEKRTNG